MARFTREEFEERYKWELEYEEKAGPEEPDDPWAPRRTDDEESFNKDLASVQETLQSTLDDLSSFAKEWEIPFAPEMALRVAGMFTITHGAWDSSHCW